jgi:hypothetical protein
LWGLRFCGLAKNRGPVLRGGAAALLDAGLPAGGIIAKKVSYPEAELP